MTYTHRNIAIKRLCRIDAEEIINGRQCYWVTVEGEPVRQVWHVAVFDLRHEPVQAGLFDGEALK